MGFFSTLSAWRMKFFLWAGLPLIAAMGIMFGSQDLGPAWKAHNGNGTVGTFTATDEDCGRRSCTFNGSWVAADGSRRLDDIIVYDEPDSFTVGDTLEAIDSGARNGVFATRGGSTYLLITAFVVAGTAALVGWIFVIRNAFRRRRQNRDQKAALNTPTPQPATPTAETPQNV